MLNISIDCNLEGEVFLFVESSGWVLRDPGSPVENQFNELTRSFCVSFHEHLGIYFFRSDLGLCFPFSGSVMDFPRNHPPTPCNFGQGLWILKMLLLPGNNKWGSYPHQDMPFLLA